MATIRFFGYLNYFMPHCPLCRSLKTTLFYQDKRDYYQCSECLMVFVTEHQFLSLAAEKAMYDRHNNSPDDPYYRTFLGRLFKPVAERLAPQSLGLDFGSGPGPTLSLMFEEVGHNMMLYDKFYAPDEQVFMQTYDFITSSEVVEHLSQPREELERLWSSLKPNGILGIMTKRILNYDAFTQWHYKNDPTHICFFSINSFQWLAQHWDATLIVIGNDVVLLIKK